ncbi:MAG: DUF4040 domain-containing protein [Clostridiales bacterium]|nr:DUF4040 domain-containing protein [Clostridiales bacterium]
MNVFMIVVLGLLVVCAIATSVTKSLLASVVIFMAYSLLMCMVWMCLQSPDLAVTEAAVGAGVTSVLFFIALKKIHAIRGDEEEDHHEEK